MRALAPGHWRDPSTIMTTTNTPAGRAQAPIMALGEYLPFRISVLSDHLDRAISALHKQCSGIGRSEWRVLVVVGSKPDLCAAQIVEETQLDKVAVSRAVARLLNLGYLERTVAASDRRRSLLRLTQNGDNAYADTVRLALSVEKELLGALDDTEIEALRDLNDRLLERASNMVGSHIRTNTGNKSP